MVRACSAQDQGRPSATPTRLVLVCQYVVQRGYQDVLVGQPPFSPELLERLVVVVIEVDSHSDSRAYLRAKQPVWEWAMIGVVVRD